MCFLYYILNLKNSKETSNGGGLQQMLVWVSKNSDSQKGQYSNSADNTEEIRNRKRLNAKY